MDVLTPKLQKISFFFPGKSHLWKNTLQFCHLCSMRIQGRFFYQECNASLNYNAVSHTKLDFYIRIHLTYWYHKNFTAVTPTKPWISQVFLDKCKSPSTADYIVQYMIIFVLHKAATQDFPLLSHWHPPPGGRVGVNTKQIHLTNCWGHPIKSFNNIALI